MRRALFFGLLLPLACSKPPPPPAPPPAPSAQPITFKSTPAGAHVTLDGQAVPDATPFTRQMEPGSGHHSARFALDGYDPADVDFLVPLAPYTAEVTLKPAPKVPVTTEPTGASVALDGKLVVPTTPGELPLTSGEHDVVVTLSGYVPVRRHLKATDRAPLKLKLQRSATLSVKSDPPGAHVLVDGADTGLVTPADNVPVAAGKAHQLSVKLDKLRAEKVVKALKPAQELAVELKLADLDRKALENRRRALKAELARLEAQQRQLEKKTSGFFVKNVNAEQRDEHQLDAVEQRIDDVSNQLADLNDQLDGP